MDLNFTLSEMENIYNEAYEYYNVYKSAIKELDTVINNMSDSWISKETHTYEAFKELYKEKYPKLKQTEEAMLFFCKKIEEKKMQLEETSNTVINSFE